MDWHKRYHQDALDGYRKLSLDLRGAYTTVLDLIYTRGAPIPGDMPWLAGWFGKGCTPRKAKGYMDRLVRLGKLYVVEANGGLAYMNERCAKELSRAKARSELAGLSANARWSAANKNNDLPDANAMRSPSISESPSESSVVGTHRSLQEGRISQEETPSANPSLAVIKGGKP